MSTVQGTAAFRNGFQSIDRITLRSLVRRAAMLWLLTRIALQLIIGFASVAVDGSIAGVTTAISAVALLMAVDVRLRKTRGPIGLIRLKNRSLSPVAKLFVQAASDVVKTIRPAQSRAAAARK